MAQYKVPQDVEADDKLLGPFSFRQFVYLLIAGGLIALAVGLFQLFPLLAIIPIPPIILLVVLALPIKKDQPMETYLAAIVSYYLKPHTRLWTPGQRDSVIKITAPKIIEEKRTRDISGEEANHRLSFLADIVDTEGYAIKGTGNNLMRDDLVAEASMTSDMFESYRSDRLETAIQKDETARHNAVMRNMHEAIEANDEVNVSKSTVQKRFEQLKPSSSALQEGAPSIANAAMHDDAVMRKLGFNNEERQKYSSPVVIMPDLAHPHTNISKTTNNFVQKTPKPSIIELANNSDYSVETIAKEAKRINKKESEVFISLH